MIAARVFARLVRADLVANVIAVARYAIRPTVGVDTTGRPAAPEYVAALDALRGAA